MNIIPNLPAQQTLIAGYIRQWTAELNEPGLSAKDYARITEHIGLFKEIAENLIRLETISLGGTGKSRFDAADRGEQKKRREALIALIGPEPMSVKDIGTKLNITRDMVRNLCRPLERDGIVRRKNGLVFKTQGVQA